MGFELTAEEMKRLFFLVGQNDKILNIIQRVAERQRGSIELHRRGLRTLTGLPSQSSYTAPLLPVCVERAGGSKIIDVDGHEYIDCHMGFTASLLGHNPEPVIDSVRESLAGGAGAGHFFKAQLELGELVCEMIPAVERVSFFHSGSEAVAASIRMARATTGKMLVAKFEGCYHGWTDVGLYNTMMILAGRAPDGPLEAIKPQSATGGVSVAAGSEFLILPYNSSIAIDQIRKKASSLACVLVNPVPPFMSGWLDEARAFVSALREVTSELGVPLIFDEVVSGFRLSKGGAQEAFSLSADLSCYGKITSGLGIPLTMVAGKARFLDISRTDGLFLDYRARKAWLSSTNTANFVSVVSALAQLRYLNQNYDKIMTHIDRNYDHLDSELQEFSSRTGIVITLQGHSRLQPMLTIGEPGGEEKTYRGILAGASLSGFRSLLALTLYLRLEGIYAETVPTMYLSAAHTQEDVERIAIAVKKSLLQMRQDGLLDC
jgi:glutamate-1-semialdehyde 2,1-aminomutase